MKALDLLKLHCNKYTNGICQSAICLERGMGRLNKPIDFSKAKCEYSEAIEELEKIQETLERYNSCLD